jgi:methylated-DNA-[protein]-cysteine S-methyltransferase
MLSRTSMTGRTKRVSMIYHTILPSPLGDILLTAADQELTGISFQDAKNAGKPLHGSVESAAPFQETIRQLKAYFRGELKSFNLRLLPEGTEFQRRVWKALCDIPYGTTISYGELAKRIGKPKACRAVGGANGRNPLPIVVPCHRVIAGNGQLGGYSCGLGFKEYLLDLEANTYDGRQCIYAHGGKTDE